MLDYIGCILTGFIGILAAFFWYTVAIKSNFILGIVMCLIDIILALKAFSLVLFVGVQG